jgi:hypothetical protein
MDQNKDDKNKQIDDSPTVQWTPDIEYLLSAWCDHAKCFEWMHTQSHDRCVKRVRNFMISINCLTAFSGLSNVIAGGYNYNGFQISWVFGGLSILVSTLNMLQDKLGYAQRGEQHRKLASEWDIIRSRLEEILILPVVARKDCKTFLKFIKTDMNQSSADGNAIIPNDIREMCYDKFSKIENFDIPEICGQMEHTKTYSSMHQSINSVADSNENLSKENSLTTLLINK